MNIINMLPSFKIKNKRTSNQQPATSNQQPATEASFEEILNDLSALRPELTPDFIKTILLNQSLYLQLNGDVKDSKLCPVYHYYTFGSKEGREFCSPDFRLIKKQLLETGTKKIIFFDVSKDNASFLYRGFFLELRNDDVQIIHQETELIMAIKSIFSANEMIFIRPSFNSKKTKYFINLCKILNIKISMNFDDLLLPEYVSEQGAVRSRVFDASSHQGSLINNSAMLLNTEELILSSKKLGEIFSGFIDNIYIKNNRLPLEYFLPREEICKKITKEINGKINLFYLSGSKTHLKDYSLISGCLIKLAMEYPDKFCINFMGKLNNQVPIFLNLGVETKFIPFASFEEMIREIGRNDLVLVPLENTVFNNVKSNIKFIEAASQGVPVIASSVDEYKLAIESGVNGWLCEDEYQWYDTLKSIILLKKNIRQVGLAAYDTALRSYSI
ncbi:glycosyltransferase [Snodgrassella communis]|uniref:glycosyltransferase n=1 Tax=Snodgrassella communis TaxID=2946699 RepID=UPI001EF4A3D3|nr:glycosyltransferase [Snodgrassella communis]